jgi:hypothetical protein
VRSLLIPDAGTRAVLQPALESIVTIDLFELPQREKYRQQIMELRQFRDTERGGSQETWIYY